MGNKHNVVLQKLLECTSKLRSLVGQRSKERVKYIFKNYIVLRIYSDIHAYNGTEGSAVL